MEQLRILAVIALVFSILAATAGCGGLGAKPASTPLLSATVEDVSKSHSSPTTNAVPGQEGSSATLLSSIEGLPPIDSLASSPGKCVCMLTTSKLPIALPCGTIHPATGIHQYWAECGSEPMVITVNAIPSTGWEFLHWIGGATSPSIEVVCTFPGNNNCVAVFGAMPPQNLDVGGDHIAYSGKEVCFTAKADGPNGIPLNFNWDFGDGEGISKRSVSPPHEVSVCHVYDKVDTYTVNVTVCDEEMLEVTYAHGRCTSDSFTVQTVEPPTLPLFYIELYFDPLAEIIEDVLTEGWYDFKNRSTEHSLAWFEEAVAAVKEGKDPPDLAGYLRDRIEDTLKEEAGKIPPERYIEAMGSLCGITLDGNTYQNITDWVEEHPKAIAAALAAYYAGIKYLEYESGDEVDCRELHGISLPSKFDLGSYQLSIDELKLRKGEGLTQFEGSISRMVRGKDWDAEFGAKYVYEGTREWLEWFLRVGFLKYSEAKLYLGYSDLSGPTGRLEYRDELWDIDFSSDLEMLKIETNLPISTWGSALKLPPDEAKTRTVYVDSTARVADFYIHSPEGVPKLCLYKPDGTKIDPPVASSDTRISYTENEKYRHYVIKNPDAGDWVIEVNAIGASTESDCVALVLQWKTDSQGILWTRQFGTEGVDKAWDMSVDSKDNLYVVGQTDGAFPDWTHWGNTDVFVRKYGKDGNERWTHQIGTSGIDRAIGAAVDEADNLYVIGGTDGALLGQVHLGKLDTFLHKYDSDGNELWTLQFGTEEDDEAQRVELDDIGDLYVVGSTHAALPGQTHLGKSDAFVCKYNGDGNELWTCQFGTQGEELALDVTVDSENNLYVVGQTGGAFPGQTHLGNTDAFVRKYDSDGNELWTRQFGTEGNDIATGTAVDGAGNLYVAGDIEGHLPGQTHLGKHDAFVRKYDSDGNELWTLQFGTSGSDRAWDVAVDRADNPYVVGHIEGALPGQTHSGDTDAFVRKYDKDGNEIWTLQLGTQTWETGVEVKLDASGDLYMVGQTEGALPKQSNVGGIDAFLVKKMGRTTLPTPTPTAIPSPVPTTPTLPPIPTPTPADAPATTPTTAPAEETSPTPTEVSPTTTPTPSPRPGGFGCNCAAGGTTAPIDGGAFFLFAIPLTLGILNCFRRRRGP